MAQYINCIGLKQVNSWLHWLFSEQQIFMLPKEHVLHFVNSECLQQLLQYCWTVLLAFLSEPLMSHAWSLWLPCLNFGSTKYVHLMGCLVSAPCLTAHPYLLLCTHFLFLSRSVQFISTAVCSFWKMFYWWLFLSCVDCSLKLYCLKFQHSVFNCFHISWSSQ